MSNLIDIRVDLREIKEHAQRYMQRYGIEYQYAVPQSMSDSWWFINCRNAPDPLPEGMVKMTHLENPYTAIGFGLSREMADSIVEYRKSHSQ